MVEHQAHNLNDTCSSHIFMLCTHSMKRVYLYVVLVLVSISMRVYVNAIFLLNSLTQFDTVSLRICLRHQL